MSGPGNVLVCQASLIFVQRGGCFHELCDSESADLQETSCLLFNGRGEPRHPQVKAHLLPWSEDPRDFLYIDDLAIEAGQEEVAPQALRAMLLELQEQRGWALVAFYRCAPSSVQRQRREIGEAEYSRLAGINRLAVVRAGLVQVEDGPVYFAAPQQAEAPVLPRAQALAAAELQPPAPKAKSPEDEELFTFAMQSKWGRDPSAGMSDKDLARVKALLAKGATLQGSHALHVSAARGNMACFLSLLTLLPYGPSQLAAVNACVAPPSTRGLQAVSLPFHSHTRKHATHSHSAAVMTAGTLFCTWQLRLQ